MKLKSVTPRPSPTAADSAVSGVRWVTLDTVFGRVLSAAAQVALGAFLSAEEYGVYGLALALTFVVRVYQDGGVREILIAEEERDLDAVLRSASTVAWVTNSALAGLLLIGSWPMAGWYDSDELGLLIVLVGVALLANSGWAVSSGLLRRRLEFRKLVAVNLSATVIQFVLPVVLVVLGLGVESVLYGLVVANLWRTTIGYVAAGFGPTRLGSLATSFRMLRRRSAWLVGGSLLTAVMSQGDYLVLSRGLSTAELGVYFFAFQLANQAFFVAAVTLQNVLTPYLAETIRQNGQFARMIADSGLATIVAATVLGVVVMTAFIVLDSFVWKGSWEEAMPLVAIFSVSLPYFIQYTLLRAVLMASTDYRRWVFSVAPGALLVLLAASAAILLDVSLVQTALIMGGALLLIGTVLGAIAVARSGGEELHYLGRLLRVFPAVAATGAAGYTVAEALPDVGERSVDEVLIVALIYLSCSFLLLLGWIWLVERRTMSLAIELSSARTRSSDGEMS